MELSDILLKLLMGACMVIAGMAKHQSGSMQKQIDYLNDRLDTMQKKYEGEIEVSAALETKLTNCPEVKCPWRPHPQPN